jgi:alkanesulfonate monooxygenase SsuD/methylene tetrahydromethanopterin reductase-like flavin-dependent oxidoreductase (luciferase family)
MKRVMNPKFGLSLPNRAVQFEWWTLDHLIEAAQMGEDCGLFDSVWVGDNFLSKPRLECIVTLSAIAVKTSKVRLGTACFASFPLRHPVPMAIQWATLDILSHGRTILNVCTGAPAHHGPNFALELDNMGVDTTERVGRLVEGIRILRKVWTEDHVDHEGRYYTFKDLTVLPKPVQTPVPIWIAVNPIEDNIEHPAVDRVLRRVAKHADGWQSDATPAHIFGQRWQKIREYASAEGRDPDSLESSIHLMVNINDDEDAAFKEAAEFFGLYFGQGFMPEEKMKLWLAYGTPAQVIQKIQAYLDAGCTTPVVRLVTRDFNGQFKRLVEEVLPAFQV